MNEPSQQERLMAFIHLNDVGVFLLEQKCYRQAFETFHEALNTLATGFPSHGKSCSGSRASVNHNIDTTELLEKARARILSKEVCPYSKHQKFHSVLLEELKCGDDIDAMIELLPDNIHYIVMRIGNTDFNKEESAIAANLVTAVAMFNFGVAHSAYARALREHKRPLVSNVHRCESQNFLGLSESVLARISSRNRSEDLLNKILALRMITQLALGSVAWSTDEVKQRLHDIRGEILCLQISKKNSVTASAA